MIMWVFNFFFLNICIYVFIVNDYKFYSIILRDFELMIVDVYIVCLNVKEINIIFEMFKIYLIKS